MVFKNIRALREDYETGKIEWTATMLIKLSKFYGTSVDYLLGLIDTPKPYSTQQK